MSGQHPFEAITRWAQTSPGHFSGHPDASWYQGKAMFGGMLSASLLRALRTTVADDVRLPRTLTVHFCAPVKDAPAQIVTAVERMGARVTHTSARLLQDGKPACLASATFAMGRAQGPSYQDDVMPTVTPYEDLEALPVGTPLLPIFTQHFEFRFCGGHAPFSSAAESYVAAWVRPRQPLVLDPFLAAALLDVMPPAFFTRLDAPAGGATVDLTMAFFEPLPRPGATADEPYLTTVRSRWAHGGYAEQLNQLWTRDGVLLGQCRQMVAMLS